MTTLASRPIIAKLSDPAFAKIAKALGIGSNVIEYKLEFEANQVLLVTSTVQLLAMSEDLES
jgi:hypothetical protein